MVSCSFAELVCCCCGCLTSPGGGVPWSRFVVDFV